MYSPLIGEVFFFPPPPLIFTSVGSESEVKTILDVIIYKFFFGKVERI